MISRDMPPELDQMVDTVLGYDPRKAAPPKEQELPRKVKSWQTNITNIFDDGDVRLDATHFDPDSISAVNELEKAGHKLDRLGDIAEVYLRGQFTRIWAEDAEHGIPYLNATDMMSLLALGVPAGGARYLSKATDTDIDALIVHSDWLLMTCSGTIGRVFYVPNRLDGWASTHDLIRIVAPLSLIGYLYAWLTTDIAQSQVLSHTHGGQIDHVTDEQVQGVLVPRLDEKKEKEINNNVLKALRARERAMKSLLDLWGKANE